MIAALLKPMATRTRVPLAVRAIGAVLLIALLPWLGLDAFWAREFQLIAFLALLVSGLNLAFGYAGELILGQAAAYAAGAYMSAWMSVHGWGDLLLALPASALIAAVAGVFSGAPGLRLGGWMLAIASFFLVLLIPDIVNIFGKNLGGYAGLAGLHEPQLAGQTLTTNGLYVVIVVTTALWFVAYRNIAVSRNGSGLRVLKESGVLARAVGLSVYRQKLAAYVLGSVPAGIAGCLFANLSGYISTASFSLDLSIAILAAAIFSGIRSIYAIFVGAALLELGPLRSAGFEKYAGIAYGIFLVFGGLVFADGVSGIVRRGYRRAISWRAGGSRGGRRLSEVAVAEHDLDQMSFSGTTVQLQGISKNFGGVAALRNVDFRAEPGQVTALIGPNGSGKTSLLNIISGFYRTDEGSVHIGSAEATHLAAHLVARAGVARTFQTPIVPTHMSVRDVVITGRAGTHRTSMLGAVLRTPGFRRMRVEDAEVAGRVMHAVGIAQFADEPATSLALGTRRLLELARALASEPSVILLDEIASGLDESEVENLATVLRRLRSLGMTLLLVEHNFPLVREVADRIVVLAEGSVVTAGSAAEVEAHPDVIEKYLSGASTAKAVEADEVASTESAR